MTEVLIARMADETRAKCRAALDSDPLRTIAILAGNVTGLVEQVHLMGPLPLPWQDIIRRAETECIPDAALHVARYLLLTKIVGFSLDSVLTLRVPLEVRHFLYDEFVFIAEPVQNSLNCFEPGSYPLASLCQETCLQRFPVGQLHVVESGFSRRWLLRMRRQDMLSIAWHVFVRMGGHHPYYVPHNAHRKKFSLMFLEKEQRLSMMRIAEMLKLNSHVRGLMATGWLHSPNLGEASPHLKWMMEINHELTALGAAFTTMGPASEDSGFLIGDKRRIALYRSGQWKPQEGLLIAPRKVMIQWARQQSRNKVSGA